VAKLIPNLNVLPERQRHVWNLLGTTPRHFVLYGGTALALRLGHRESVDFDFFSSRSFAPLDLLRSIPYLHDQPITQEGVNTLSCAVRAKDGTVGISFFGGLPLHQIATPEVVESNGVAVASLLDIFGMKCATIPQRNEVKDYHDIHALLVRAGISLAEGIAAAAAIYGRQYNAVLTLQALTYFDDLPEPLPEGVRTDLLTAVKSIELEKLPLFNVHQRIGDGIAALT
jgi:hypothetical protein